MQTPEATVRAYFAALNNSDTEAIVHVFAEDGIFMADEAPTAVGHEELRDRFEATFKGIGFDREVQVDTDLRRHNLAYVQTHSTGTITMLATGVVVPVTSRELFVLRKIGTDWRVVAYMFNRPEPAIA